MTRILILFAHPALEKSRVHRALIRHIPDLPGLTFHDLYEAYPAFDIDVAREQTLLLEHDLIILQHPFFWYSTPPILKQWEDLVLEHGWAYGSMGKALRSKRMLNVISTGGQASAYQREGYNRFTIRELLAPIEQTAYLCGMEYLPPCVFYGSHRMVEQDIQQVAHRYSGLLRWLHESTLDYERIRYYPTLNDALEHVAQGEVAQ